MSPQHSSQTHSSQPQSAQNWQTPPGILFADDFDDEDNALPPLAASGVSIDTPPPEPPPPCYSEAELQAAQLEAREQGHRAGSDDLVARHALTVAAACSQIAERLATAAQELDGLVEQAADATAKLLFEILSAMLPSLARRHDASEIAATVHAVMAEMTPDMAMCVTVAPELTDDVRAALVNLPRDLARRVVIAGQEDMPAGDAKLVWKGGAATRSSARMRRAITEILSRCELLEPVAVAPSPAPSSWKRGMDTTPSLIPNPLQKKENIDA